MNFPSFSNEICNNEETAIHYCIERGLIATNICIYCANEMSRNINRMSKVGIFDFIIRIFVLLQNMYEKIFPMRSHIF